MNKIALIGDSLDHEYPTGINNYILNLIEALAPNIKIYLIHAKRFKKTQLTNKNIIEIILPSPKGIFSRWKRHNIQLPLFLKRNNFDIVHSPEHIGPFPDIFFKTKYKKVITIHDLAILSFPRIKPYWLLTYLRNRYILPVYIKRCDAIIADSNSTKKDIAKRFKINSNKIKVIYGASSINRDNSIKPSDNKYVLFVGTIEPRKNIKSLVYAFKKSELYSTHNLIIIGCKGYRAREVIKAIGNDKRIILKTDVSNEELPGYYANCSFFVFPSIYEGFGIPILEAMTFGKAVLASYISSIPEVGGEAACYFDPNSIEDMVNKLNNFKESNYRRLYEQNIKSNLARFSWEKAASELLETYQQLST